MADSILFDCFYPGVLGIEERRLVAECCRRNRAKIKQRVQKAADQALNNVHLTTGLKRSTFHVLRTTLLVFLKRLDEQPISSTDDKTFEVNVSSVRWPSLKHRRQASVKDLLHYHLSGEKRLDKPRYLYLLYKTQNRLPSPSFRGLLEILMEEETTEISE